MFWLGGFFMTPEEKKRWAKERLCEKQKELGRAPKKGDFDDATRSRIKAFLGAWPRALEAAGLKEEKGRDAKGQKRYKSAKNAELSAMRKAEKYRAENEETSETKTLTKEEN